MKTKRDDNDDRGTDIRGLIAREQQLTGASYADIAKASGLSKAKIGQMALDTKRYQIRAETIEKLALGLRLPVAVVQRAALVTAGVAEPSEGRNARVDLIVHQLSKLSDEDLKLTEAVVDVFVKHRRG